MSKRITKRDNNYNFLIQQISLAVNEAKNNYVKTINHTIVITYWNIGKHIVEFEQEGNNKAKYGEKLLVTLSKDLTVLLGKGYSKSNLFNMRLFYLRYPIFQTVSGILSWSHIGEPYQMTLQVQKN